MFKRSIATRLSMLYAVIFGVTVLIVVVASSIALIAELSHFEFELLIGKHEEARVMAQAYTSNGLSLAQAAPAIVEQLSGLGTRVAVFDRGGHFLAGDRTLHPRALDALMMSHALKPPARRPLMSGLPPSGAIGPPGGALVIGRVGPLRVTPVSGGFVAIDPSTWLLLSSLEPYWLVIIGISVVAIVVSLFSGRLFAAQTLRPLNDVTDSLHALADGDYTQRRFITAVGDEIATLTAAYNDAAASVGAVMEQRRSTEERMRLFVAEAGHELRTPLTVIGGYIDVLRRGAVEDEKVARQILGTMALEKEHMRSLIDRLMRLARLDAETEPRADAIDLADLLRTQCDAARRLDEQRAIDYSVDGAREVVGDRSELGEALWNIVENALKYAPEAPIHLRASRTDGHTAIAVSDEGPGMSELERLHAFERFYRGDQRGEIAGSGLGLAIAKRAVERAGGTIAIDSTPGRGTTVTITI